MNDQNTLLSNTRLSDTDVSLLSWLHALPTETFSCPFEQKALSLNIDKLQKPILEATWAEHVLSTPFKPQTMFPFNATPTGKPRSTELMSRSLAPQYDGLSYGLIRSQIFGDYNRNFVNDMSRSLAICNLKDNANSNIQPTGLPTVEETPFEETPPPPTPSPPVRTFSPAPNIISPQTTHRAPSPKRATNVYHSQTIPVSQSTDHITQQTHQHLPSPSSVSINKASTQFNQASQSYKQTTNGNGNGATNENGTRISISKFVP